MTSEVFVSGYRGRHRVILESPYRGDGTPEGTALAARYLDAAIRDSIDRGEAPLVLRDDAAAICEWRAAATMTVVYTDLGISEGMEEGIRRAKALGHRIECRTIPGWAGGTP